MNKQNVSKFNNPIDAVDGIDCKTDIQDPFRAHNFVQWRVIYYHIFCSCEGNHHLKREMLSKPAMATTSKSSIELDKNFDKFVNTLANGSDV